jgi:Kae1-associated kinase Bud32
MQKIEGKTLKNAVDEEPGLLEKLAEQVSRLHSTDVIHGDITTSNAIVSDGEVYLIDFGLSDHSDRVEDKAVDIHLLKQVLKASHTEEFWEIFAEKYREEGEKEVVEKVSEIEDRARYK